jgi:hypothetical protein
MPVFIIRSIVALLVVAMLVLFAAPAAAAPVDTTPGAVVYAPPVDAPISDPFRPPSTPYGPGNRGIEYATSAGTTVVASANGVVTFAGVVAGRRWLTITHTDGVRTTYGPLDEFGASGGQQVQLGDPIGTAAGALLFTARVGDAYIDPASLFDGGPPRVHLVPEPLDLPALPKGMQHGWSVPGGDALLSAIDWERRHLTTAPAFLLSLTPAPAFARGVTALVDWEHDHTNCTQPEVALPLPTTRRFAVLVGGLGSSSASAAVADVDTSALGYASGDVVRFSYAGGRVAQDGDVADELSAIEVADYGPRDTVGDLAAAGHRLALLLVDVAEAAPEGTSVDVIAHSQGGVVALLAIEELAASHPEALVHLGAVVTLATPFGGADLAALVRAAATNPVGPAAFDAAEALADLPISPDDVAVRQLVPGSDLLTDLAATPLPQGVSFVSVAARTDLIVPSGRAELGGATNVIVTAGGLDAHDQLPGSAAASREIGLAIAGLPPSCESAANAVVDAMSGELISNFEHALAATQGA